MRRYDDYTSKAEGLCCGIPYNTEFVNINGVSIHFLIPAELAEDETLRDELLAAARRQRDIVGSSYSIGAPESFWAHEDFGLTSVLEHAKTVHTTTAYLGAVPVAAGWHAWKASNGWNVAPRIFFLDADLHGDSVGFNRHHDTIVKIKAAWWTPERQFAVKRVVPSGIYEPSLRVYCTREEAIRELPAFHGEDIVTVKIETGAEVLA